MTNDNGQRTTDNGQRTSAFSESSLRVTVLDPTGAAIGAARVRLSPAKGGDGLAARPTTVEANRQGVALFRRLSPGPYQLLVEAPDFLSLELGDVQLHPGDNQLEVRLEVAPIVERLDLEIDRREAMTDPTGIGFTTILTQDQIALLPDDPEEFEAALRQMAGPASGGQGVIIRVNGFRGGRLPPKSHIREIRFRLNPYAAEYHEMSLVGIDIYTKPGASTWHTTLNFGFRDEALHARNAFAPVRGPEQLRRFGLTLDGPLWRNRTSIFLSAEGSLSFDPKTIVAVLPEGDFNDIIRHTTRHFNGQARLEHALSQTHTLRAEYQRNDQWEDNLGVGNFDLPERAYIRNSIEHLFRVSDTGLLTKRVVNELRFQTRWQDVGSRSISDAPAIVVLDAFKTGGGQVRATRRLREIELADTVSFASGQQVMKAGFELEIRRYRNDELRNGTGTFTFGSLEEFELGFPITFVQRVGDPFVGLTQVQVGWFFQDDIRLHKSLSLSLGLRHELQTHLDDKINFAPRIGLAWSPTASGKTTIRAGAGLFYSWFSAEIFEQTLRVDGVRQHDIVVVFPGFPDPFSGGFQVTLPPSRIQQDPTMVMPYVGQISASVQRQLGAGLSLMATYLHQRGVHLLRGHNINAPPPGGGDPPDPNSGNVIQVESVATSRFHLFNVSLSRFSRRFHFFVAYSLSKAINETDTPLSLPADNFNLRAERGPASFDARHRFSGVLNLRLFKGLTLANIFRANSAQPYNITTGFDDNRDTAINDRPEGLTRNSARGAAHWDLSSRLSWGFGFGGRRNSAAPQAQARVVRVGPNDDALGALPSGADTSENRWYVQFYIQAYNVLNHVNPTNFVGVQPSPFFGQPTAASQGRRFEAGLRINFGY